MPPRARLLSCVRWPVPVPLAEGIAKARWPSTGQIWPDWPAPRCPPPGTRSSTSTTWSRRAPSSSKTRPRASHPPRSHRAQARPCSIAARRQATRQRRW
eukprot:scaffold110015_cov66-Phaeocystis_antarctica.AAC.2